MVITNYIDVSNNQSNNTIMYLNYINVNFYHSKLLCCNCKNLNFLFFHFCVKLKIIDDNNGCVFILTAKDTAEKENYCFNTATLATNLASLLVEKNISESELAKSINIPYNTIKRLVDGVTTDPRLSTLKEICSYFGVPLDSLVSSQNRNLPNNSITKDTPLSVPMFTWENISNPEFFNIVDLKSWSDWYPIPPVLNEDLNISTYALESRPSMQPRFPIGTVLRQKNQIWGINQNKKMSQKPKKYQTSQI
jgi:DNA-binding Xre family transcriptional regulator